MNEGREGSVRKFEYLFKSIDPWIFIANEIYETTPGSNEGVGK